MTAEQGATSQKYGGLSPYSASPFIVERSRRDPGLPQRLIKEIWKIKSVEAFLDFLDLATRPGESRFVFAQSTLQTLLGNLQRDLVFFVRDACNTYANVQGVEATIIHVLSETIEAAFSGILRMQYNSTFTHRSGWYLYEDFKAGNPLLRKIVDQMIVSTNKLATVGNWSDQQKQSEYYCHVVQVLLRNMINQACDYVQVYAAASNPNALGTLETTLAYRIRSNGAQIAACLEGRFLLDDAQIAAELAAKGIYENTAPMVISPGEEPNIPSAWRELRARQLAAADRISGCFLPPPTEAPASPVRELFDSLKYAFGSRKR